ncbi:MAG TPA: type II toxin-antitoxin system VapC family toxin [Chloroflexota bacterium]|nr:type II toxin-antitoxin system VapC family toxin [Chloroflexota bacterium]
MAYLIDTDWAIDALGGRERAARILERLGTQRPHVSLISVAEIYDVAFNSPNPDAHLARSRRFLSAFQVLGLSDQIAERFAETRAFLRRRGLLIADLDLLIAATALHHDLTLLAFNVRHFERVPGLRVFGPS